MLKVALTGGIATGKSYVLERFGERGVPTIDADAIVHDALGSGTATTAEIERAFGREYLLENGAVDRAKLGVAVFRDALMRSRLEKIVHPVVYDRIEEWFQGLDAPIGVACIPLLYETGHDEDFDVVVVTLCTPQQQLERVVKRDAITQDEALRRIAAQMPAHEKAWRADFVIHTSGSKTATDQQIDDLLASGFRHPGAG